MKTVSWNLQGFLLALGLGGLCNCRTQKGIITLAQPIYEISRFRRTSPTLPAILTGHTGVRYTDASAERSLAGAIIALNKQISFADESGNYVRTLEPGTYRFYTGQVGIKPAVLSISVEKGDSVQIDFHLHQDTQSID